MLSPDGIHRDDTASKLLNTGSGTVRHRWRSNQLDISTRLQGGRRVLSQRRRGRHGHVAKLAKEVGRLKVGQQQCAAAALAGARRAADAVDVLRLVGRQTQLHGTLKDSDFCSLDLSWFCPYGRRRPTHAGSVCRNGCWNVRDTALTAGNPANAAGCQANYTGGTPERAPARRG